MFNLRDKIQIDLKKNLKRRGKHGSIFDKCPGRIKRHFEGHRKTERTNLKRINQGDPLGLGQEKQNRQSGIERTIKKVAA